MSLIIPVLLRREQESSIFDRPLEVAKDTIDLVSVGLGGNYVPIPSLPDMRAVSEHNDEQPGKLAAVCLQLLYTQNVSPSFP